MKLLKISFIFMKKPVLIFLVCAIAVGGGLAFYFSKNKNQSFPLNSEIKNTNSENFEKAMNKTDNDMSNENLETLAKGKSLKCEINEEGVIGTYYIDGKNQRVRVISKINEGGKTIENNILVFGKDNYSWTDDGVKKEGYKFSDAEEGTDGGFENIEKKWADLENEMGVKIGNEEIVNENPEGKTTCQDWKVDEAMFVIPKDIDFKDMSELNNQFEKMIENPEGMNEENLDEYMKQLEGMGVDLNESDLEMLGDLNE